MVPTGLLRVQRPQGLVACRGKVNRRLACVPVHCARNTREKEETLPQKKDNLFSAPWRNHFHESDPPDESRGPSSLVQRVKEVLHPTPLSVSDVSLPLAGGALGLFLQTSPEAVRALSWAPDNLAIVGLAVGVVARLLQLVLLEQSVPFTKRRHSLLLPVGIEMQMGLVSYAQIINDRKNQGQVLPEDHPDSKLVHKVADRIIQAVEEGYGGGFQSHVSKFEWEITVVKDKTANAFVLPGGKIVVFTGILDLLNRQEDLLATIIGHECAHALARHSAEKMSFGLFIGAGLQLLLTIINLQQGGRRNDPRYQRGGYGRNPYGGYRRMPGGPRLMYTPPSALEGLGAAGPGVGGLLGSILGNPRLINLAVNLLLQLPFSRRAEAEADLIGLKLMSLAGYNAAVAPKTFDLLEEHQKKQMGGAANASYVQTHPRSSSRVQLLQQELELMQEQPKNGKQEVLTKVPYWML